MKVKKELKYDTMKFTEKTWVQPILYGNGTLGGNNEMATNASTVYDGREAWGAWNDNGWWWAGDQNTGNTYTIYTQLPIKMSKLTFTGQAGTSNYITSFNLYGGNSLDSLTLIGSFSGGTLASKTYDVNSTGFYQYHRLLITGISVRNAMDYAHITSTYLVPEVTTGEDYDYIAPNYHYSCVKKVITNPNGGTSWVAWENPIMTSMSQDGYVIVNTPPIKANQQEGFNYGNQAWAAFGDWANPTSFCGFNRHQGVVYTSLVFPDNKTIKVTKIVTPKYLSSGNQVTGGWTIELLKNSTQVFSQGYNDFLTEHEFSEVEADTIRIYPNGGVNVDWGSFYPFHFEGFEEVTIPAETTKYYGFKN